VINRLKTLRWLASNLVFICPTFLFAQQTPDDSRIPPKRAHHSVVFDPTRGEVILYGGGTAVILPSFLMTFGLGMATKKDGGSDLLIGNPPNAVVRMAVRNQGVADAVGMLVLKMSTASFQLSPSRFHTTTYLPLSVVVVPAPGAVEV
jgi:hypothetical protein